MRLVDYLQIVAGGPGSGCHGDNCGRPPSGWGTSNRGQGHGLIDAPSDRSKWPEHIQALKVPPAWTDVKINPDKAAVLQVLGKDAKGRAQYLYTQKFRESQAAAKFERIKELDAKFDNIRKQNDANLKSPDKAIREHAACTKLIMSTGIRPGNTRDTLAKVQAYGATTLLGKHVVQVDGEVRLQFTGKKGVALDIPAPPKLASILTARAAKAGPDGLLFKGVTESSLLNYTHKFDGGGFKTKDFRTLLGTREAMAQMKSIPRPKTEKEYKKAVMAVAKVVASKLGNTPSVALVSYISPVVFAPWRSKLNAA